MAWPNLSNDYLQGGMGGYSSVVSPQSLNFTGTSASQIPLSQFGGQMDQASNWMGNLPSVGGAGGAGGLGFGLNIPTAQLGLGALNSLAGLWGGFQAQKLAREQFDFTKNMANTNLANQTQAYNTQLADRLNARARMQGQSDQEAQAQIERNRLPTQRV